MKLHTKLTLGLISSLFVASLATAAAHDAKMSRHHPGSDCNGMGMMSGDMGKDPAAGVHRHLSELKAKLKLTQDQQPAWQTFSDQVNDQAKHMMSMQGQMKDKAQTMPERMAKMADVMKEHAQDMSKMADNVKTFYATLTPEQQAAFDKMHRGHKGHMQ